MSQAATSIPQHVPTQTSLAQPVQQTPSAAGIALALGSVGTMLTSFLSCVAIIYSIRSGDPAALYAFACFALMVACGLGYALFETYGRGRAPTA